MGKIVAAVIFQNEKSYIPGLIENLEFCDELYMCDGGSTDGSDEIVKNSRAHYFYNKWPGFGRQRQFVLDKVPVGSWVLQIDCDERVNTMFAENIRGVVEYAEENGADAISFILYNLVDDECHYQEDSAYPLRRMFLYTGVEKYKKDVHEELDKETETLHVTDKLCLAHLARLNPERLQRQRERYEKLGVGVDNYAIHNKDVPVATLPKHVIFEQVWGS